MYNAKYHEENEELDDELFQQFVNDTKIFTDYKRNEKYSSIDYSATDIKGRRCLVELKRRNFPHTKYETILCECEKFWTMFNRYEQFGLIPLYLNFFNNDTLLIFDLRKINNPDKDLIYIKITIMNHGYEEKQTVWRVELPTDIATLYKKIDGKWTWVKTEEKDIITKNN